MRVGAGTGLAGLLGVAPAAAHRCSQTGYPLRFLRPFLAHVTKGDLLRYCCDQNVPFVVDPSNASLKYTRNRVRRALDELAAQGTPRRRLYDFVHTLAAAREALETTAQALVRQGALRWEAQEIHLVPDGLLAEPAAVHDFVVAGCLAAVSGGHVASTADVQGLLAALSSQEPVRGSTAQCHWARDSQGVIRLSRRPLPQQFSALLLRSGETRLWDGRVIVRREPGLDPRSGPDAAAWTDDNVAVVPFAKRLQHRVQRLDACDPFKAAVAAHSPAWLASQPAVVHLGTGMLLALPTLLLTTGMSATFAPPLPAWWVADTHEDPRATCP